MTARYNTNQGSSGTGTAVPLREDTGAFWFFNSENLELMVKVLDGCGLNDRFWVFSGGLTDQGVTLTVTDTVTGIRRTYTNPVNRPYVAVQDTSAFATCG